MSWIYLSIAIFAEIIATTALKKADGFSVLGPSIVTISGYAIAFYFLSLSLKHLNHKGIPCLPTLIVIIKTV